MPRAALALLALAILAGAQAAAPKAAPAVFAVQFRTTAGNFTVEVHTEWAPRGARRFYQLAESGYFNGDAFFRVVSGFVVQWGLNPNPARSAYWDARSIPDDPVAISNQAGTLSFAAKGRNTRTSQVFINVGNNARLDKLGFAPFARVVAGWSVVRELESEYGERPDQAMILKQGAAYLTRNFPRLDVIYTATVVSAARP